MDSAPCLAYAERTNTHCSHTLTLYCILITSTAQPERTLEQEAGNECCRKGIGMLKVYPEGSSTKLEGKVEGRRNPCQRSECDIS